MIPFDFCQHYEAPGFELQCVRCHNWFFECNACQRAAAVPFVPNICRFCTDMLQEGDWKLCSLRFRNCTHG
jgi:hypothetical protein